MCCELKRELTGVGPWLKVSGKKADVVDRLLDLEFPTDPVSSGRAVQVNPWLTPAGPRLVSALDA